MKRLMAPEGIQMGEESLLELIRCLPDKIVLLSAYANALCYRYANDAALTSLRFSAENRGMTLEECCGYTHGYRLSKHCRKAMRARRLTRVFEPAPLFSEGAGEYLICPVYDGHSSCTHLLIIVSALRAEAAASLAASETASAVEVRPTFFESHIKQSPDAILTTDVEGRIIYCNKAFETMFGWPREHILGLHRSSLPIFASECAREIEELIARLAAGEVVHNCETIRRRADGVLLTVSINYACVREQDGREMAFTAVYRDITEQKKTEADVREKETSYKLITENMPNLITWIDRNKTILYASPSYGQVLGFHPEQIKGTDAGKWIHPEDKTRVKVKFLGLLARKEPFSVEFRQTKADGGWLWMEMNCTPYIINGEIDFILCMSREITERKRYEERMAQMTFYDDVTGAPNLRLFKDRLQQAVIFSKRYGHLLSLLYLDLDDFRLVNLEYGYSVGDRVMKEVADRVAAFVGERGTTGRLAGDEFMVCMQDLATREKAVDEARELLQRLSSKYEVDEREINITGSIGIAFFPDDCADGISLIDYAHAAMYTAKEAGKNNCKVYAGF